MVRPQRTSIPVNEEQVTMGRGSSELDSGRLETCRLVGQNSISAATCRSRGQNLAENDVIPWIHPAVCQRNRMMVAVQRCKGRFSLHTSGPYIPTEDVFKCLNATAYLSLLIF